jgi:hypothetical protein
MSMLYREYTFCAFKKLFYKDDFFQREEQTGSSAAVRLQTSPNAVCTAVEIEIKGACARMQCGVRL